MPAAPDASPSPNPTPVGVVRALLHELSAAGPGDPTRAAERLLEVAAPRLHARLGNAAETARLLASPLYRPLLEHLTAALELPEAPVDAGNAARVHVTVTSFGGEQAHYTVGLVRPADGLHAGRWLLSGLRRDDAGG